MLLYSEVCLYRVTRRFQGHLIFKICSVFSIGVWCFGHRFVFLILECVINDTSLYCLVKIVSRVFFPWQKSSKGGQLPNQLQLKSLISSSSRKHWKKLNWLFFLFLGNLADAPLKFVHLPDLQLHVPDDRPINLSVVANKEIRAEPARQLHLDSESGCCDNNYVSRVCLYYRQHCQIGRIQNFLLAVGMPLKNLKLWEFDCWLFWRVL